MSIETNHDDVFSSQSDEKERFKLLEIIGTGSFAHVYKGFDTVTQKEVAVKVIDLDDLEEDVDHIYQELDALRACSSPNITEFYGAVLQAPHLLIAMELMAVSAEDLIHNSGVDEEHIAYILREVLNALVYLHSHNRIHRDIKAANILLSPQGDVKMSDFGVSAQLTGNKKKSFVGSPLWMAPEVICQTLPSSTPEMAAASEDGYNESADMWSLGITALELGRGEPPRAQLPNIQALFSIVHDEPPTLDGDEGVQNEDPQKNSLDKKKRYGGGHGEWSQAFRDFVGCCLQKTPSDRSSALDLLMHPFVMSAEKPKDLDKRIEARLRLKNDSSVVRNANAVRPDTGTVRQKASHSPELLQTDGSPEKSSVSRSSPEIKTFTLAEALLRTNAAALCQDAGSPPQTSAAGTVHMRGESSGKTANPLDSFLLSSWRMKREHMKT